MTLPSDLEIEFLQKEAEQNPDLPKPWFELAGAYDFLGRELEALPHYQRALDLGFEMLPPDDQPRLFAQMGSTLRNLKEFARARKLLEQGLEKFPENSSLHAFLGLVEYSDGAYRKAAKLFLRAALGGPNDRSISDYRRALESYREKIDVFPARQRNWMRIPLADCTDPTQPFNATPIRPEHAQPLAELMDVAYAGTIDHEGETREQCLGEMKGTLEGKYGPFVGEASFVSMEGAAATSASMITIWKSRPLLAFSMTAPSHQGRGLGGFLIRKSLFALKKAGYRELYLVVTEGNVPAEKLYAKLGFELLGPAIPGRAASDSSTSQ